MATTYSHQPEVRSITSGGHASHPARQGSQRVSHASSRTALLRLALLSGSALAISAGLLIGTPGAAAIARDAELDFLLRGMAMVKAALIVPVALAVLWRFRLPITPAVAAGYVVAVSTLTLATVLIWQLAWIAPAALAFHAAVFGLLWLALRDDRLLQTKKWGRALPQRTFARP